MVEQEEVLVTLLPSVGHVSAVRSTLIQSSLHTLQARGLYDRYVQHLPAAHHETVLRTLAPTWLPISAGLAHYHACEALGLSEIDQVDMGTAVGARVQHGFLRTLARTGQNLGVSPWTLLKQVQRVWDRTFQGGGCALYKVGPKDARADMHGLPLAQIGYFRNAWRGAFMVGLSLVCTRAFCKIAPARGGPNVLSYRVSWV
jgi:hypothetical protein